MNEGIITTGLCDTEADEFGEVMDGITTEFLVHDQRSAEWLMERLSEADAEIVALQKRLDAAQKNFQTMIGEQQRRRASLLWKYGQQLEHFARAQLHGKRSRTWTCQWGQVALRLTAGSVKIKDMERAADWAEKQGLPIHTERKVLVGDIKDKVLADQASNGIADIFEISPASEKVSFDTNVK